MESAWRIHSGSRNWITKVKL